MRLVLVSLIILLLSGCSRIPIKDGALDLGGNTSATMDEAGVARITKGF